MSRVKSILYCILLFLAIGKAHANGHYEVVIHPDVDQETISVNVLRAIFSMRMKTWPNGKIIKVYVLPDNHPLHHDFAKEKLSVFPYQLRSTWDRLVFSGTGQAPITVSSNKEMLEKITNTPGAIGYLETAYINDDVHVLKIK
ncbi:hypothetical protein [Nitrosomonas sp.]|uniref:hypothetical protein n=1 Tax=Nitrosomonas sp. TaxID=42353 RepID=UPI00208B48BF|nr:hypothetical protein [Nitrosomonas sp.]GJL76473.1 MAG: hypothetical protein NMNS02_25790 [Nitrosomonas sp.]